MFSNKSRELSFKKNPLAGDMPLAWGSVKTIDEDRAEVRLFTGETLQDVRLPGGKPEKTGKAHGVFGGLSEKQLVLVGFLYGSSQNPVIIESYPFFSEEKDSSNLKLFRSIQDIKSTDIVVFHESGYSVWLTDNKIEVRKDPSPAPIVSLDLQSLEIIANVNSIGFGPISVPNGDLLLLFLNAIVAHLNSVNTAIGNIQTALSTSPTSPTDGGATYKAAIAVALATNTLPTVPAVPTQLNSTNLKQGPSV